MKKFRSKTGRPCQLSGIEGEDCRIRYLDTNKFVTIPYQVIKKYLIIFVLFTSCTFNQDDCDCTIDVYEGEKYVKTYDITCYYVDNPPQSEKYRFILKCN